MIVFTNGCFDIIHKGHLKLLEYSKLKGDKLIVGLNSDKSVKRLKGNTRPINDEITRKYILECIKFVDEVIIFNEDTPYNLIKKIKPDLIVKGGDYQPHEVVGNNICKVLIYDYIEGYSTTNIIDKLN